MNSTKNLTVKKVSNNMGNKVGVYEMGRLISCPHCGQDEFSAYEMLSPEEIWRAFVPIQEPWKCSKCSSESWNPIDVHACRFLCPKCSTCNVIIREPSKVELTKNGDKISIYDSNTVECFNCNTVFDSNVMNELRIVI